MIYKDINSFSAHRILNKRLLAIDYGNRKTGFASSSRDLKLCSPIKTIITKSRNQLLIDTKKILHEYSPWGIVVGFPLHLDGKENESCKKIEEFADQLINLFKLPILLYDERGTSNKAQQILINLQIKRKRRDLLDDQLAATLILESAINELL